MVSGVNGGPEPGFRRSPHAVPHFHLPERHPGNYLMLLAKGKGTIQGSSAAGTSHAGGGGLPGVFRSRRETGRSFSIWKVSRMAAFLPGARSAQKKPILRLQAGRLTWAFGALSHTASMAGNTISSKASADRRIDPLLHPCTLLTWPAWPASLSKATGGHHLRGGGIADMPKLAWPGVGGSPAGLAASTESRKFSQPFAPRPLNPVTPPPTSAHDLCPDSGHPMSLDYIDGVA